MSKMSSLHDALSLIAQAAPGAPQGGPKDMLIGMLPIILMVGQEDDAPGVVLIGLICIMAPLVTGVFAAVLQRLLQSAIELKSENDLTV